MAKTTYQIDPAHSSAHFTVRHMMIANVRGEFTKVSGTIVYDRDNPANSSIEATIDASSINTREADRDTPLKSADFLDVAKFGSITFRGTAIQPAGDGGRPDDSWRHPRCHSGCGRADTRSQGSVGQPPDRRNGYHEAEPEGLWPDLERGPGSRRSTGWR